MKLEGIHHISAITGDAPGNVEFYTGVLGLRMVKKTVNQDEPNVYHLFYGDEHGSPGMDLTFFEYPGAAPGVAGAGMVHRIVWRVASAEALEFWRERLGEHGVAAELTGEQPAVHRSRGPRTRARAQLGPGRAAQRALAGDPERARATGLRGRARLQQRAAAQRASARRNARLSAAPGRELGGARRAARGLLRV